MQPQSKNNDSKKQFNNSNHQQSLQQQKFTPSTPGTTPNLQTPTATAAATAASNDSHRSSVKIIKSRKPLCQFKFYLDICDHQLTKRIEEQIKALGGILEFFLNGSVTHFITDKTDLPIAQLQQHNSNNNNNNNSRPGTPQTPATPGTPQTPYSIEAYDAKLSLAATPVGTKRTRTSRADAILNRARKQTQSQAAVAAAPNVWLRSQSTNINNLNISSSEKNHHNNHNSQNHHHQNQNHQQGYTIWQTEYALRFFKKVQFELRDYLDSPKDKSKLINSSVGKASSLLVEPIGLRGNFIKIEPLKHNYRPYYHLIKKPAEWPKIELTRDDGAFRLSPKKNQEDHPRPDLRKMTRKSRSRSSQHRPLPPTVQALKKTNTFEGGGGGNGGGGGGSPKASTGTPRNSKINACKEVKESSDKQCGVCEICKIEYDILAVHLKSKEHEYFARNAQNFIALDGLINTSADINKFLEEHKKMELEEMEVDDEILLDNNALDPLKNPTPTIMIPEESMHSTNHCVQTPSPTLREKSKRSTKGKHSSEKFQKTEKSANYAAAAAANTTTTTTPSLPMSSGSKTKALVAGVSTLASERNAAGNGSGGGGDKRKSSMDLDSLDIKRVNNFIVAPPPSTRRKPSSVLALSPPLRPMLPQSPLYKVVETSEMRTPKRKGRNGGPGNDMHGLESPSLIVKFQKVRQSELERLNGEAENFMFRQNHPTSSDLPTDQDRQTTSENATNRIRMSSACLDSTSESIDMDIENQGDPPLPPPPPIGRKAIAKAKRRKGSLSLRKQYFPSAPIQPEEQLKIKACTNYNKLYKCEQQPKEASKTSTTSTTTTIVATIKSSSTNNLKTSSSTTTTMVSNSCTTTALGFALPEATRKSSRTATAIVTAATTSSRLQAAVEAAKLNTKRRSAIQSSSNEKSLNEANNGAFPLVEKEEKSKKSSNKQIGGGAAAAVVDHQPHLPSLAATTTTTTMTTTTTTFIRTRRSIVKLEDRMGDNPKEDKPSSTPNKINNQNTLSTNSNTQSLLKCSSSNLKTIYSSRRSNVEPSPKSLATRKSLPLTSTRNTSSSLAAAASASAVVPKFVSSSVVTLEDFEIDYDDDDDIESDDIHDEDFRLRKRKRLQVNSEMNISTRRTARPSLLRQGSSLQLNKVKQEINTDLDLSTESEAPEVQQQPVRGKRLKKTLSKTSKTSKKKQKIEVPPSPPPPPPPATNIKEPKENALPELLETTTKSSTASNVLPQRKGGRTPKKILPPPSPPPLPPPSTPPKLEDLSVTRQTTSSRRKTRSVNPQQENDDEDLVNEEEPQEINKHQQLDGKSNNTATATEKVPSKSKKKAKKSSPTKAKTSPEKDLCESLSQQDDQQQQQPSKDNISQSESSSSPPSKSQSVLWFDYTKSEHINKLRYAFERLPVADLWYRVFSRQDECKESYCEYFGSKKYRKLPYELGPIPFDTTLKGICCKLCNEAKFKSSSTTQEEASSHLNETRDDLPATSSSSLKSEFKDVKEEKEETSKTIDETTTNTTTTITTSKEQNEAANSSSTADNTSYLHRHKKLHLLQRYRKEQQELLQQQEQKTKDQNKNHNQEDILMMDLSNIQENQTKEAVTALAEAAIRDQDSNHHLSLDIKASTSTSNATTSSAPSIISKCDSKASTPDLENSIIDQPRKQRAGSTHSTASSCASSSATLNKKPFRNKHLNKAVLSLEIPPRKSPREHASTLALVSCLIRQRQDSLSKTNSETDEPPTTPTTPLSPSNKHLTNDLVEKPNHQENLKEEKVLEAEDESKQNPPVEEKQNKKDLPSEDEKNDIEDSKPPSSPINPHPENHLDHQKPENKNEIKHKKSFGKETPKTSVDSSSSLAALSDNFQPIAVEAPTPCKKSLSKDSTKLLDSSSLVDLSDNFQPIAVEAQTPCKSTEAPQKIEIVHPSVTTTTTTTPRPTRSSIAPTPTEPIEELCFATEISETVKRMRRGQNKNNSFAGGDTLTLGGGSGGLKASSGYASKLSPFLSSDKDDIPRRRGRPPKSIISQKPSSIYKRRGGLFGHLSDRSNSIRSITSNNPYNKGPPRPRGFGRLHHLSKVYRNSVANNNLNAYTGYGLPPSIRKTGSKKGVLEFEAEASALKDLELATQYDNPAYLEWEIDKYLELSCRDIDMEVNLTSSLTSGLDTLDEDEQNSNEKSAADSSPPSNDDSSPQTPPATDYFSSDFDLCDLINANSNFAGACAAYGSLSADGKPRGAYSVYSTVAFENYFRKKRGPKKNRTGWPNAQRKKIIPREHSRRTSFLGALSQNNDDNSKIKSNDLASNNKNNKNNTRGGGGGGEGGVITPPDSEADDRDRGGKTQESLENHENFDDCPDSVEIDMADSIPEEDEADGDGDGDDDEDDEDDMDEDEDDDADTMADSIDDANTRDNVDAASEADNEDADDIDEEEEADEDDDDFEDAIDDTAALRKVNVSDVDNEDAADGFDILTIKRNASRLSIDASPADKMHNSLLSVNTATSTPTNHLLRNLRRTPQLNGSLGSCISPSEKAGDNSDIFTVSSDGLETDLDLSNPHSQTKAGNDEDSQECPHQAESSAATSSPVSATPKRKLDITKYAPKNTSNTCAAEAATAAVKSLAISQFLKKEVRVTCRRLRGPFRRFRLRR